MARNRRYAQPMIYEYEGMTPIHRERRRGRHAGWLTPAVIMALVVLVVVGWGISLKYGNFIFPNVRVAGVDVGGLTKEEAIVLVEDAVTKVYQTNILKVKLPDRELVFDPQQLDIDVDAEKAVQKAMAYGRDGNVFQAVVKYTMGISVVRAVRLEKSLSLNTDYLKKMIKDVGDDIRKEPVNTEATMNAEKTRITLKIGIVGKELDEERLFDEVCRAYERGEFAPIEWNYETIKYQMVDLSALYRKLKGMTTDAAYDEEKKVITQSSGGYIFALNDAVKRQNMAEDGTILEIPLKAVEPKVSSEELMRDMFGQKLAEVSSEYIMDPARINNLRVACNTLNATIVNPGEVFSFNEVVGAWTVEKGYGCISYGIHGERENRVGEGVSQVASTLYHAALYADMTTVERKPHTFKVEYMPGSCDANVSWEDGIDYKFRNDRETPVKIQARVEGGLCIITFWGMAENDNYVTLSEPEVLETWTDADVLQYDATRPAGYSLLIQSSYVGCRVEVVKSVYSGDGKLLRQERLESLYQSRPAIYNVGG